MSDRDKDRNWRVECFGYFLMECFHISLEVHELIITLLWTEKKVMPTSLKVTITGSTVLLKTKDLSGISGIYLPESGVDRISVF